MKVSELVTALEEFQTKLTAHEELLQKRAGQRAEISEQEKQAALQEQSHWLSRRTGALRPYIERFDDQWMMQHPASGRTWDILEVATSLTGHSGKGHSIRHVLPKLNQILGRLENFDPNEEIPADPTARRQIADEDWITADSAVALLGLGYLVARRTICKRAHAGLIKARAQRFIRNGQSADDVEIPREFWWAEGGDALTQNWATGDFDTWTAHEVHLEAFGVTFRRADIELSRSAPVVVNAPSTHRKALQRADRLCLFRRVLHRWPPEHGGRHPLSRRL